MTWAEYFRESNVKFAATDALIAGGATWRSLKAAVESGGLIRVRRGHYALPGTEPRALEAVRLGGRLGCVSAAADLGIFTLDARFAHIHVDPSSSRLRSPHDQFERLAAHNREGVEVHWDNLSQPAAGTEYRVGLVDSLIQVFRCQSPRFAIASLDNALHHGLLSPDSVPGVFRALPETKRYLQPRIDMRSEAGQESVLRFIVQEAGFEFDIQVQIDGVGRVDMVIEGCLVVEADSRQFHDGWFMYVRDRSRDCDLAILGYMSYRALYKDIMFHPERVIAAIGGLLAANRNYRAVIL
jgi:very-short-patch-repair endonuclease